MAVEGAYLVPEDSAQLLRVVETVRLAMQRNGVLSADWSTLVGLPRWQSDAGQKAAGLPGAACCLFAAAALHAACEVRGVKWGGVLSLFVKTLAEAFSSFIHPTALISGESLTSPKSLNSLGGLIPPEKETAFDYFEEVCFQWLASQVKQYSVLFLESAGQLLLADDFAGTAVSAFRWDERGAFKRQRQIDADLHQQILLTQVYTPTWLVRFLVDRALEPFGSVNRRDNQTAWGGGHYGEVGDGAGLNAKGPECPLLDPTVLDPACGSGRFLLYGLEVLVQMQNQALSGSQVSSDCAVQRVLHGQLHGMEIDPLALAVCRAQLLIKARSDCGLKDIGSGVRALLRNIIRPGQVWRPEAAGVLCQAGSLVDQRVINDHPGVFSLGSKALELQSFDAVIMNPPYLDKREYPPGLTRFLRRYYPSGRPNLYGAFLARMLSFCRCGGRWAVVAPQSWLFLKSYRALREEFFSKTEVEIVAHFGTGVFEAMIDTAAVVGRRVQKAADWTAFCIDLFECSDKEKGLELALKAGPSLSAKVNSSIYTISRNEIIHLPDQGFLYKMPQCIRHLFWDLPPLGKLADVALGMKTSDNKRFVRYWWEVHRPGQQMSGSVPGTSRASCHGESRWVPYDKQTSGFPFYRAARFVVDWSAEAREFYRTHYSAQLPNPRFWFKEGITFGMLSSRGFAAKYLPPGHMTDMASNLVVPLDRENLWFLLGFLNSHLAGYLLHSLNPSVNFQVRDVARLPVKLPGQDEHRLISLITRLLVQLERLRDSWDETSPEFAGPVLARLGGEDLNERLHRLRYWVRKLQALVKEAVSLLDGAIYRVYGLDHETQRLVGSSSSAGVLRLQEHWERSEEQWSRDAAHALVSFVVCWLLGRYTNRASSQPGRFSVVQPQDVVRGIEDHYGPGSIEALEGALGADLTLYLGREFFVVHTRQYGGKPILHRTDNGGTGGICCALSDEQSNDGRDESCGNAT